MADPNSKPSWAERPENLRRIVQGVVVLCALSLLPELFRILPGHLYHPHFYYKAEYLPGFYGLYGFVGCVLLVLIAKEMRKLLKRDEDYYDE